MALRNKLGVVRRNVIQIALAGSMDTSDLYKALLGSANLTKTLEHSLSVNTLPAADSVRIAKQISDLCQQLQVISQRLQKLCDDYKVEENFAKQQIWERKLLDLSLRNNLLNLRLGKNAVIPNLVASKTHQKVLDISTLEDELDMGTEFIVENHELKGIYRAVRTSIEETGANTLFLTLGTLHWNEREGGKEFMAPILLVPVGIVSMKKDGYAIRKRDEDVILNITLMEFLKQKFGIMVEGVNPLPQDAHGIDVSLVLHQVSNAISGKNNWRIEENSVLGIFSFTKFVMWNDIHTHTATMIEKPLVRSLIEGRLLINDDIPAVDARELDINTKPDAIALPMDADSSQIEAVVEAQNGKSFILYGPPGTGKSQTITNLIANAAYHGKQVLFVAQKKAALDVVESRLAKIGLAPFCLELHSNKVEKNHFLKQMQMAIEAAGAKSSDKYKETANALYKQRVEVAGFVNALHDKQSAGCSLYECINRYLSLGVAPINIPKSVFKGIKVEDVETICKDILALDSCESVLGMKLSEHPLRGLMPKSQKNAKPAYVSAYSKSETIENQLPVLFQIIENVKKQIERGKQMPFMQKTTRQYIEGDYKMKKFAQLADVDNALLDDIEALENAAKRWQENINMLPQWKLYVEKIEALREKGFEVIVEKYLVGESAQKLKDSFLSAFYQYMAQQIISNDSRLCQFNGVLFEQVIDKYKQLTKEFQLLTQKELVARLSANIPIDTHNPELSSELTLLRKRIGNKGRGTSIRSILDQMPHLLPKLCPVMLMSPLSVAQYLDIDAAKFDIVIFDEASQMPTSEAVGAIARGKSVVIVGDPKQMPPTNFFSTNTTDDEEAEFDDLESILDDCISLSMRSRYLGWHYRSKHESLIAFSNRNYYEGRLTTFPSVDDMVSKVTHQHVDGFYDFGKTRTNRAEAEAIVAEAIVRMQNTPERSIGIIAFSKIQSDLIEDILNEELSKNLELEIQNHESVEPIFVKNLENVQGDERDVILFSIGYGPDKDGKVSMNFGPLNKVGGERRLNVAVSRARYEMKVFSTLDPEQIDERRTNAQGVLDLKAFLKFAKQGGSSLQHDSATVNTNIIIKQIADKLSKEGFEVNTNVGTSDFRIDLAVVNPLNKAEYMLGIICDGERYQKLKTARDREIVRPSVLKMLGWNLMHVWSVDWFLHPEYVMMNVLKNLKNIQPDC